METINNMAASAAKAVWGESNPTTAEPVSGRSGDTSKGEPFDAGNIEPTSANTGVEASTDDLTNGRLNGNTTEDARFSKNTGTYGTEGDKYSNNTGNTGTYTTEEYSKITGNTGTNTTENDKYSNNTGTDAIEDAKFAKNTGTATVADDTPNNPSTDLKAKSTPNDTSKGQGDTRSPEDPLTHPKSAPTDVNDSPEEGLNEAQTLDGPGPKPLYEVAKEKGGDAGNDISSSTDDTSNKKETIDGGEEENKNEGTGEEYIKSSGLKADGGDFDATNAGAGREADRLMEQKGIHQHPKADAALDTTSDETADHSTSPTSGKKSLGQKIKDKLHRH